MYPEHHNVRSGFLPSFQAWSRAQVYSTRSRCTKSPSTTCTKTDRNNNRTSTSQQQAGRTPVTITISLVQQLARSTEQQPTSPTSSHHEQHDVTPTYDHHYHNRISSLRISRWQEQQRPCRVYNKGRTVVQQTMSHHDCRPEQPTTAGSR